MKVERIQAKQAHWVPDAAHAPRGPFDPALFQHEPVIWDYTPQAENGGVEEPEGGTAQNNYRPPKYFRCKDCTAVIMEKEIPTHDCDDFLYDDDYEDEDELSDGKI